MLPSAAALEFQRTNGIHLTDAKASQ